MANNKIDRINKEIAKTREKITEYTEIAELLNTPRSTIQYRRTSSFEQLRKYLEENADEWDEW